MKKSILVAIIAIVIIAVSSVYLFSSDQPANDDVSDLSDIPSEPESGTRHSINLSESIAMEQSP